MLCCCEADIHGWLAGRLQVTVVGKVLSVTDRNTNMVLVITDGTGELEINHWLQEETDQVGHA